MKSRVELKNKIQVRNINQMAYPVLLNYVLLSVFEILDKALVGHYSIEGFAAVGIAAGPIYAITGALGILSVAFNMIAAKEVGKKDDVAFERTFVVSKNLALIIGLLFLGISLMGGRFFFRMVYKLKGETLKELLSYFYPDSITVLQNMLLFQYSAYYRNKLNTKISFYSTVISTAINLFFDVSLVYGLCGLPQIGTAGAAWGSVIGLMAGLFVYQILYYLKREQNNRINFSGQKDILKKILKLYPALFGQEFLESTLFVLVVSGVVARLGTGQMAVYSLLETVVGTIGLPIYAYATATQTYALQSKAAGKEDDAEQYLRYGKILTMVIITALCALSFPWRYKLLGWIVSDTTVINDTASVITIIFIVLLAKIPYQFHMSYLQGIEEEKFVFRCTVVATILASVGVVVFGSLITGTGFALCGKLPGVLGIYLIMTLEYLILAFVYRGRNSRKSNKVR